MEFRWPKRKRAQTPTAPDRLNVGCGSAILPGWCNVDLQALPGVDLVMDVTRGFSFDGVRYIFCEHFLEHLRFDQGVRFLRDCLRSLVPSGVLRLSTPNLDWVWLTQYDAATSDLERKRLNTFMANRAFYGWGHRFLWSEALLREALGAVGFGRVVACRYGESGREELRGLERHVRHGSSEGCPEVVILEAERGTATADRQRLKALLEAAEEELLRHTKWRRG